MICVMTSKWVGDALGKDGIYSVWIAMRQYPWLPPTNYRDNGETGANIMKALEQLVVVEDEAMSLTELGMCIPMHHLCFWLDSFVQRLFWKIIITTDFQSFDGRNYLVSLLEID